MIRGSRPTPPRIAAALVALLPAAGCNSLGPRSVTNPDPSAKIPAIKIAAQKDDTAAIPYLVSDLDVDDAAVRLYSIEGLRRMTGQDFGYRYYECPEDRAPAIQRWKDWLAQQPPPPTDTRISSAKGAR